MNRPAVIVIALLVAAATAFAATMLIFRTNRPEHPRLTDEKRLTRQKFFGSGNELPAIELGQKMRPRW